MKLLLFTRFYPDIGGLEAVMEMLADEWSAVGHEIHVATDTPAPSQEKVRSYSYEVHYQPDARRLLNLVKWCDAYVQGCVGLKTLWPLGVYRRLYVVSHQTWYEDHDGARNWQNRIKHLVARYAVNVAPSQAVADRMAIPCAVIPNPYRTSVFKRLPGGARNRDVIFVGRLVSDKGATLLLQAAAKLRAIGLLPSITIVGDGPERSALQKETEALGLNEQVVFTGLKSPTEVAKLLNQHRIFVVPSVWNEPFGVVALEGIACGCLVIGSQGGGLPDAIGPCGLTFPNGDVSALTERLKTLLAHKPDTAINPAIVQQHLARHQPAVIAQNYIDVIVAAANRQASSWRFKLRP